MGLFGLFSEKRKGALSTGLEKDKTPMISKLTHAVTSRSRVDNATLDDLEGTLMTSDVDVDTTLKIIKRIEERVTRDKYVGTSKLKSIPRDEVTALLTENGTADEESSTLPAGARPYVIIVVGVNGVGETTIIDKLAHQFKQQDKHIILGAADTFRVTTVGQLEIWGERVGAPVVKQQMGSDPASVTLDTLQSAVAQNADMVIIDTAGRLHSQVSLVNELSKIKRVMMRVVPDTPHGVLLVLDGSTGQNASEQAKRFTTATGVSALTITKLDGMTKDGVAIGIPDQFKVPVKYIGLGEKIEDLQVFHKREFVNSIFGDEL